tara:strand:+ start:1382 stop:2050 length:669 start_codon:yes stop_codon:yes gene_type:complete
MSLLKIEKINKSYLDGYSELNVLSNISINIESNEIIILMGPSGSGKTTLLNLISHIDSYDDGKIEFDDNKLNMSSDNLRKSFLGLILQNNNLLPEFTVLENLTIPFKLNEVEDHHDPIDLLKTFSLDSKINNYPNELSAGEAQRISLLRAIINKPKIILADEPTANLDYENLQLICDFILNIRKKYSSTFIIATHDERLCDLADKILYLDNGKLTERKKSQI